MESSVSEGAFVPSAYDIDMLIDEVLESVWHGMWPLYMIEDLGRPFLVSDGYGNHYDICPWQTAMDYLFATDELHRIHWMHPALEARLRLLDAEDFYPEVGRKTSINELTRRETAEMLDASALAALATLRKRQRVTDPIYTRIRSLPRVGSVEAADALLRGLFKEEGIDEGLGWSLAQVALRALPSRQASRSVHKDPSVRAVILSKLVDPAAQQCPEEGEIRRALVTLSISDSKTPDDLTLEISQIAAAIAHGAVPANFAHDEHSPIHETEMVIARIERGDHDPTEAQDYTPHGLEDAGVATSFEKAIASRLDHDEGLSAHALVGLVAAADARLAALGYSERVDPARIKKRAALEREIPF